MEIISLFENMNIPLTAGIIGKNWNIGDVTLGSFIAGAIQRAQSGDTCWRFSIANHGWEHEDFSSFSLQEQVRIFFSL
jgi:peptidoglycan/xylan/chitin deacetylase (PgdA/CDA1 family)